MKNTSGIYVQYMEYNLKVIAMLMCYKADTLNSAALNVNGTAAQGTATTE